MRRPSPALDVERHVAGVLEKEGLPRFETSIEVEARSPQVMLERFFGGLDLECGPAGGAPSETELREFRPHPGPYIDFLAIARLLADLRKRDQPPRYFLYRVQRGATVRYDLREGRVPDAVRFNTQGIGFELVGEFPDLDSGSRAWRRAERNVPEPASAALAPQPWQTYPCRPRR